MKTIGTNRFTQLHARLSEEGFKANRRDNWLDRGQHSGGYLRFAFEVEDERVIVYRFDHREILQWQIELAASLPESVFHAAVGAAIEA